MINESQPLLQILQKEDDGSGCQEVAKHIINTTVICATVGGAATAAVPAVVGLGIDATVGACLSDKEGEKFCTFGLGIVGAGPGLFVGGALGFFSGWITSPIAFFCGAPARCTEVRENIIDMVRNRSEPAASSQEAPQGLSMK